MNPLYIAMGGGLLFLLIGSIGSREPTIFLRAVINGIIGVFAIIIVNRIWGGEGLYIGTNPFTLGMISLFGIPGFVSVATLAFFL